MSTLKGEIASTEVKNSDAPLLLSIQAQQALGLVVDFGGMTIKSRTLGIDFAAVRGRRNQLLGLRLTKADGAWSPDNEAEFALMADDGEYNAPSSSSTTRAPPTRGTLISQFTEEVIDVPTVERPHRSSATEVRSAPKARSSNTRPSKKARSTPPWRNTSSPAAAAAEPEEEFVEVLCDPDPEEPEVDRPFDDGDWAENYMAHGHPDSDAPGADATEDDIATTDVNLDGAEDENYEDVTEDAEDRWVYNFDQNQVIRMHNVPRTTPYRPETNKLDLPIALSRLSEERRTYKLYEDGTVDTVTDDWRHVGVDTWIREDHNVTTFQGTKRGGPHWENVFERRAYDIDSGTWLKIDKGEELLDTMTVNRPLPDGVRNIRTELYMHTECEEDKTWTGKTVFNILPLDENARESQYVLGPDDSKGILKGILKKGQKKKLQNNVAAMEQQDLAMWGAFAGTRPKMPKGFKLIFELFRGAAVSTRLCQSRGYEVCSRWTLRMAGMFFDQTIENRLSRSWRRTDLFY